MTLFYTENLYKRFGGLVATNDVSLCIETGEIHALIGPNGAGKSTLVNLITGFEEPDSGDIVLDGQSLVGRPAARRVQAGLGRCFQVTNIFIHNTVLDNLLLAVQAHTGSSFKFFARRSHEQLLYDRAEALATQFGLQDVLHHQAGTLAHGMQRRLDLALALAGEPKLLLLDEPMAGMGPEDAPRMLALIRELNQQATILLIEHDMETVFQLADRVSVLVYGQILKTGRPDEIKNDSEVQAVYLGADNDV
ncbi:MAG TPA: ABC transporter ATP-binding protein [Paenalcaligenes sp.]|nr:ABC transporter ATP-binding protein [Paenalcaligenes sp.]